MRITTNNVPRDVIQAHELTEDERKEFDYMDWNAIDNGDGSGEFMRYKGELYDLGEFTSTHEINAFAKWDGWKMETYFSGLLMIWIGENFEQVIVGRYCT